MGLPDPLRLKPHDGLVFVHGDASLPPEFHRQRILCVVPYGRVHVLECDYDRVLSHASLRVDAEEAAEILSLPWRCGFHRRESIQGHARAGGHVAEVAIYRGGELVWHADLETSVEELSAPCAELSAQLRTAMDRYEAMGVSGERPLHEADQPAGVTVGPSSRFVEGLARLAKAIERCQKLCSEDVPKGMMWSQAMAWSAEDVVARWEELWGNRPWFS